MVAKQQVLSSDNLSLESDSFATLMFSLRQFLQRVAFFFWSVIVVNYDECDCKDVNMAAECCVVSKVLHYAYV